MEGSVARAVCVFSEGAHELVGLMNKMYMDISFDTLRLLAEKDERHMKKEMQPPRSKHNAIARSIPFIVSSKPGLRMPETVMYMVQEPTNIVLWPAGILLLYLDSYLQV